MFAVCRWHLLPGMIILARGMSLLCLGTTLITSSVLNRHFLKEDLPRIRFANPNLNIQVSKVPKGKEDTWKPEMTVEFGKSSILSCVAFSVNHYSSLCRGRLKTDPRHEPEMVFHHFPRTHGHGRGFPMGEVETRKSSCRTSYRCSAMIHNTGSFWQPIA